MPADWFPVLSVVTEGGVTTSPVPANVPTVTTRVLAKVSGVTGFSVTVAARPGPVTVLQVSVTVAGVATSKFTACMFPAKIVSADNPISACVLRLLNAGKFI